MSQKHASPSLSVQDALKEINEELLTGLELKIQSDDDYLRIDIEGAVVDAIVKDIKQELKHRGFKTEELDAEAVSNASSSGLRFKWDRIEVPVCVLRRDSESYEIWLRYTSGYNRQTNPNAPYILKRFEVVAYPVEEEGGEEQ